MHRSGADSSLAALQAGASLPGHVLDVVVLTADAGVLATLREASGVEHAVWHAPSPDAAVDLLIGGRCAVLIADLGALRGDAAAFFERLHAQFPELVLLATGRRDEEGAVACLISSGLIYRFLHKPVSPARAGLFLSAATRRYHELHNTAPEPIGMTTIRTVAMRPTLVRALIAGAVLLIVAITVLLWWSSSDAPAPGVVPQQHVSSASIEEQIATLMGRAQIAFARDQLAEPRGDNALEHYRSVLALQPDHAEAKAGVARVASGLEQRVIAALAARNAPQGRVALAALQRAEPSYPRLDDLRAQLIGLSRSAAATLPSQPITENTPTGAPPRSAAQTRPREAQRAATARVAEQAPPVAAKAAASDTTGGAASNEPRADDLQRVTQLRERGALVAPAGANAYEALSALRAAYPQAEALRAEEQRLAFALLEQARTALAAANIDAAAVFLERAEDLVPGMATTKALQQQLAAAQAERAFATNIVQAANLKRTREVAAVYPREAQREGVEGWVDVEFTITADGTTTDFVARRSQPANVFDKAAIDSVRRWRFEPVMRNGQAAPQRAVLRVRFALN